MGFILYIVASALSLVLFGIGILFGIVQGFFQVHFRTGLKNTNHKFLVMAKSIDKLGNVFCAELFNATLINRQSQYRFGKIEQTISIVIGYNVQAGTLSRTGRVINRILDHFEKDHSLKAIESDK
jgi:hypothetical protein